MFCGLESGAGDESWECKLNGGLGMENQGVAAETTLKAWNFGFLKHFFGWLRKKLKEA